MKHTILILGPSGSGKTTFFASFYKKLSLAGNRSFFLKTKDDNTRKHLVDLYAKLVNGEIEGTRKTSSLIFDCCIQNSDQAPVEACELSLIDYKGGSITDVPEQDVADSALGEDEFTQATKEASALLAILDGEKVLAFMQDTELMSPVVHTWIQKDLDNVLQIIQKKGGNFPLHLLISKWDVLVDAKYSLKDVKQRLLQNIRSLQPLINKRDRAKRPVYLIPVSAFGQGFASLKNGRMVKNPGTVPNPFGVEIPLALILTDLHKDIGNKPSVSKPVESPVKQRTGSRLGLVVYFLIGFVMIVVLNIWGLLLLGAYMLFRLLTRSKTNRASSNKISVPAVSSEDALHQLLSECHQIREDFLDQFPDAICTEIQQGVHS